MLTRRGRLAAGLGIGLYVAAWAVGSEPLYPVAVGLMLGVALAWLWVRVLNQPMALHRTPGVAQPVEGDDVDLELLLTPEGRVTPSSLVVVERIEGLGEFEVPVRRWGGVLRARHVLPSVPRGRYPFAEARAVIEDPFGLERTEVSLPTTGALLVYPRLTQLDHLFSESGALTRDGRKLLLRRPSGFDLHSVREYQEGESLRKVHWPTTARRGRLMVKELEDAPRDEVAVLLDAGAGMVAGAPPDSSFDMQVRAAGSILATHARRGRRAVLVVNSLERETHGVRAEEDADWHRALEVLAAAQPNGRLPVAALLADDASPAARSVELAVVTSRLSHDLVDRLVQRALGRRAVSVVYVEAPSFAGARRREREPALLRLQATGVPVAVLRRGDDLAVKLSGHALSGASHA